MVGRCISYGNSPFVGDMLVFRGVDRSAMILQKPLLLGLLAPLLAPLSHSEGAFSSPWASSGQTRQCNFCLGVGRKNIPFGKKNIHCIYIYMYNVGQIHRISKFQFMEAKKRSYSPPPPPVLRLFPFCHPLPAGGGPL